MTHYATKLNETADYLALKFIEYTWVDAAWPVIGKFLEITRIFAFVQYKRKYIWGQPYGHARAALAKYYTDC